jgi:hypothetical protein
LNDIELRGFNPLNACLSKQKKLLSIVSTYCFPSVFQILKNNTNLKKKKDTTPEVGFLFPFVSSSSKSLVNPSYKLNDEQKSTLAFNI